MTPKAPAPLSFRPIRPVYAEGPSWADAALLEEPGDAVIRHHPVLRVVGRTDPLELQPGRLVVAGAHIGRLLGEVEVAPTVRPRLERRRERVRVELRLRGHL